jgi:hypothetical protein
MELLAGCFKNFDYSLASQNFQFPISRKGNPVLSAGGGLLFHHKK